MQVEARRCRPRAVALSAGELYTSRERVTLLARVPGVVRGPREALYRVRVVSTARTGYAFVPHDLTRDLDLRALPEEKADEP